MKPQTSPDNPYTAPAEVQGNFPRKLWPRGLFKVQFLIPFLIAFLLIGFFTRTVFNHGNYAVLGNLFIYYYLYAYWAIFRRGNLDGTEGNSFLDPLFAFTIHASCSAIFAWACSLIISLFNKYLLKNRS